MAGRFDMDNWLDISSKKSSRAKSGSTPLQVAIQTESKHNKPDSKTQTQAPASKRNLVSESHKQAFESKRMVADDFRARDTIPALRLGSGSFGTVRSAWTEDESGNVKTVVVKQLKKADSEADAANEVAILEHLSSGGFQCKSFAPCFVSKDSDSQYEYIMTEYLGGYTTLTEFVAKQFTGAHWHELREQIAPTIVANLVFALNELHRVGGVVHRDIKPDNIMINSDLGKLDVKWIDFGFASTAKKLARGTFGWGSDVYLAPEQYREDKTKWYSFEDAVKADYWALGSTIVFLLGAQANANLSTQMYAFMQSKVWNSKSPPPTAQGWRDFVFRDAISNQQYVDGMLDQLQESTRPENFASAQQLGSGKKLPSMLVPCIMVARMLLQTDPKKRTLPTSVVACFADVERECGECKMVLDATMQCDAICASTKAQCPRLARKALGGKRYCRQHWKMMKKQSKA